MDFYQEAFKKDSILLAEEDSQLIGYIQFGDASFPLEGLTKEDQELQRIYFLADYQGKGIGRKLIDAAMNSSRIKQCRNIYLDVWEENTRAQKLYKSLGFKLVGRWDEDIIMVKRNS